MRPPFLQYIRFSEGKTSEERAPKTKKNVSASISPENSIFLGSPLGYINPSGGKRSSPTGEALITKESVINNWKSKPFRFWNPPKIFAWQFAFSELCQFTRSYLLNMFNLLDKSSYLVRTIAETNQNGAKAVFYHKFTLPLSYHNYFSMEAQAEEKKLRVHSVYKERASPRKKKTEKRERKLKNRHSIIQNERFFSSSTDSQIYYLLGLRPSASSGQSQGASPKKIKMNLTLL
uniref:hypothetical protein n=1 Tax=Cephaleuros parasiticus TaxID=173370 RepID=UPI001EDD1215|nr:hypothetical protein MFQ79_pgp021 [Cephaleuros parasiticus]UIB39041.1 hypothetical protein [Cephaleuros parasiticus]